MAEHSFWNTFKNMYSQERWLALMGAISIATLAYLTSEKLCRFFASVSSSGLFILSFIIYVIVFTCIITGVYIKEIRHREPKQSNLVVLAVSMCSMLLDMFIISSVALLALLTVEPYPQGYMQVMFTLLVGALPVLLGSITLSTLTVSVLQKRIEEHKIAVRKVLSNIDELQKCQKKSTEDAEKVLQKLERMKEKIMQNQVQQSEVC